MKKGIFAKAMLMSAVMVSSALMFTACGKPEITEINANVSAYYQVGATDLGWKDKNLKVVYSNNETKEVKITEEMVGEVDLKTAGKKFVTITYNGEKITKPIYVADKYVKGEGETLKVVDSVVFEDNKSYIYENCKFTTAISSTVKGINLLFDNCEFNAGNTGSGGDKCIYLTSFKNLEVLNSTFGGTTSTGTMSTAGYGLDLNIYSTAVESVVVRNNKFNITGPDNKGVAISIKTRLGETDKPSDGWANTETKGTITGKVIVEGNTFTENNNRIYLGTGPKGSDTANTSSGDFETYLINNKFNVNVYERSKLNKQEDTDKEAHKVPVEAGKTVQFGNNTTAK